MPTTSPTGAGRHRGVLKVYAVRAIVCWKMGLVVAASAQTALPVIVSYEMARQHAAATAAARDPRSFWIAQVLARLEDRKPAPPAHVLRRGGLAVVGFTVARDGHVVSKAISKSSGVAAIDAAAIKLVEAADPFPPMPQGLRDGDIAFALPFRYR